MERGYILNSIKSTVADPRGNEGPGPGPHTLIKISQKFDGNRMFGKSPPPRSSDKFLDPLLEQLHLCNRCTANKSYSCSAPCVLTKYYIDTPLSVDC